MRVKNPVLLKKKVKNWTYFAAEYCKQGFNVEIVEYWSGERSCPLEIVNKFEASRILMLKNALVSTKWCATKYWQADLYNDLNTNPSSTW